MRLGIGVSLRGRTLLAQKRRDASDVLAHFRDPVGLIHLAGGGLEAQVELFLLELQQLVGQLVDGLRPEIGDLGHQAAASAWAMPASRRVTTLVRTGSLAAPRRSASRAMSSGTPSISNRMRPGWQRAAQWSTAPLPLPIRTSAGLPVTGRSGNTRIHTRP